MFIQKIPLRKGMEAYYSELPNKQADQNKRVGRDFYFFHLLHDEFRVEYDEQLSHLFHKN